MSDAARTILLDEAGVRKAIARMASELVSLTGDVQNLSLVGIHRRGVDIARWMAEEIRQLSDCEIPTGSLDITLYRDDLMAIGPRPVVGATTLPKGGIEGRVVAMVDDVLFTGRTIRAALNELSDFGRPRQILLCVLVDRGGRELPIHADIVGSRYTVAESERVEVLVPSLDDQLSVTLVASPNS